MAKTLQRTVRLKYWGMPCFSLGGRQTAVWQGDEITVLRRLGSHYLCKVVYGYWESPQTMGVWLHKRAVK
jgi:hypothetical protein